MMTVFRTMMIRMMTRMMIGFPIPRITVLHDPGSLQYLDMSLELGGPLLLLLVTPRERYWCDSMRQTQIYIYLMYTSRKLSKANSAKAKKT